MKTYKLFITEYSVFIRGYRVRELVIETNDIYHEIGKIYCNSFVEIKRISYKEV